eukprot:GHVT01067614.1.p1 GENE.GHVT01067614.1~~GHVT01067614.1.p1  ORF type:complete len:312 (-),score=77.40 GHVT01067614.1:3130-3945(-)
MALEEPQVEIRADDLLNAMDEMTPGGFPPQGHSGEAHGQAAASSSSGLGIGTSLRVNTFRESLALLSGRTGERIGLARMSFVRSAPGGIVSVYVHNPLQEQAGEIAVAVALGKVPKRAALPKGLSSAQENAACEEPRMQNDDVTALIELGRRVAMHISVALPLATCPDRLPTQWLERERRVAAEQTAASGKPPAVQAKMLQGKLQKAFKQVVLTKQEWMLDDSKRSVAKVLEEESRALGLERALEVKDFMVFKCGQREQEQQEREAEKQEK